MFWNMITIWAEPGKPVNLLNTSLSSECLWRNTHMSPVPPEHFYTTRKDQFVNRRILAFNSFFFFFLLQLPTTASQQRVICSLMYSFVCHTNSRSTGFVLRSLHHTGDSAVGVSFPLFLCSLWQSSLQTSSVRTWITDVAHTHIPAQMFLKHFWALLPPWDFFGHFYLWNRIETVSLAHFSLIWSGKKIIIFSTLPTIRILWCWPGRSSELAL